MCCRQSSCETRNADVYWILCRVVCNTLFVLYAGPPPPAFRSKACARALSRVKGRADLSVGSPSSGRCCLRAHSALCCRHCLLRCVYARHSYPIKHEAESADGCWRKNGCGTWGLSVR